MNDFSVGVYKSRLINARKEKNLSQKQMAELLNVQRTTYSTWEQENKTSYPNIETLFRICRLLNVSSDYLIGLSDLPYIQSAFRIAPATIPRDPLSDLTPARREKALEFIDFLRQQQEKDEQSHKQEA